MERALILLISTVVVFVAPAVRGTFHLSFSNNTEVNITRAGCDESKLCVETPNDCDPAGSNSGSCLFASFNASAPVAPNGTDLMVELSGSSSGYIAVGLTSNPSQGIALLFACAQNNGTFFFRTFTRNNTNNMLTAAETITREIRGTVNNNLIQCEFEVPRVNATTLRTNDTDAVAFVILLGSGPTNGTAIGNFTLLFTSNSLNITNPAGNFTSSGARVSPSHAVLFLLSVLTLSVLKVA